MDFKMLDGKFTTIKARSLPEVSSDLPRINWNKLKHSYSHLEDLPLKEAGGKIDILLEADHLYLLSPSETREGGLEEPWAVKTKMGWIVRGPVVEDTKLYLAHVNLSFGHDFEITDIGLNYEFIRFCEAENDITEPTKAYLSKEEQRALDIVEKGTRKFEKGYECPLTWKEGEPNLPNK